MTAPAYCTILARNYLPSALTLAESLRAFGSQHPLYTFVTDATAEDELPVLDGVQYMTPADLGLPQRTPHELAMSYDLVEFATAIKPLVFKRLLERHQQAFYLDPDTYQVSPMVELGPALEDGAGIVLTPHYLRPAPAGNPFSEGHLLNVGVYNLGFCGVDRKALPFLDWWWSHLRSECLHDPLSGLFVDQKWIDIGSVLFGATSLQHHGYNVSVANLHERPIDADADGYYVAGTGDRLRLFHFHAFDPLRPEALCTRASTANDGPGEQTAALAALAREYADKVIANRERAGPAPAYRYNRDTTGRPITRRMRHAYRVSALASPGTLPSPFIAAEAEQYERWRKRARGLAAKLVLSDIAKGVRLAMPDEYGVLKRRLPALTTALRRRYVEDSGIWG